MATGGAPNADATTLGGCKTPGGCGIAKPGGGIIPGVGGITEGMVGIAAGIPGTDGIPVNPTGIVGIGSAGVELNLENPNAIALLATASSA